MMEEVYIYAIEATLNHVLAPTISTLIKTFLLSQLSARLAIPRSNINAFMFEPQVH